MATALRSNVQCKPSVLLAPTTRCALGPETQGTGAACTGATPKNDVTDIIAAAKHEPIMLRPAQRGIHEVYDHRNNGPFTTTTEPNATPTL
ncbi:MAG: hypothetical protein EXQ79_06460 [Acidimicrobiia bacterium]|nr:hypothetical protein [Acidimicrobiia bacterium]